MGTSANKKDCNFVCGGRERGLKLLSKWAILNFELTLTNMLVEPMCPIDRFSIGGRKTAFIVTRFDWDRIIVVDCLYSTNTWFGKIHSSHNYKNRVRFSCFSLFYAFMPDGVYRKIFMRNENSCV